MRSERWYWLLGFCSLSVCIHCWLVFRSRPFVLPVTTARTTEIEVLLLSPPGTDSTSTQPLRASQQNSARPQGVFAGFKEGLTPQTPLKPSTVAMVNKVGQHSGGLALLRQEKPLPLGVLTGKRDLQAPRLQQDRPTIAPTGGNDSPAPQAPPGGHSGLRAPEALPEHVISAQGGAGGENLSGEPSGIGGGHSVLSVTPLTTRDMSAVEKPAGAGRSRAPGAAMGEGHSSGAELPGAASKGTGYGQGNGPSVVSAAGAGVGDGPAGPTRGIPFGDVTGLLRGNSNGGGGSGGGPGGPGSGVIVHRAPSLSSILGGHVHIVYVLDTSGSMSEGNKIGKAQEALRKALAELEPWDTFDVINFDKDIYFYAPDLVPATLANVLNARSYVDHIRLGGWTFLSGALEAALAMQGATQIFVLSDGEPNRGIEDFGKLLAMVRERNQRHVQINTLALGLGEKFKGMVLLKALAEENNGSYNYINLAK